MTECHFFLRLASKGPYTLYFVFRANIEQRSVSIRPRMSLMKFARSVCTDPDFFFLGPARRVHQVVGRDHEIEAGGGAAGEGKEGVVLG